METILSNTADLGCTWILWNFSEEHLRMSDSARNDIRSFEQKEEIFGIIFGRYKNVRKSS